MNEIHQVRAKAPNRNLLEAVVESGGAGRRLNLFREHRTQNTGDRRMEDLKEYYKERERKNEELIVTMGWALAFGFGLGVLYGAARLVIAAAHWIF